MFEWLHEEISTIKTRKFHLVDGPASLELKKELNDSKISIPPSCKSFILEFGNAKLYRDHGIYLVQVLATPLETRSDKDEALLNFGRTDMSLVYFKESLLVLGGESPVFEWQDKQGLRKVANGFEEWLIEKCQMARKLFPNERWKSIKNGPQPFNQQEIEILEARRHFRWRMVGIANNGDLRFEVHNGSDIILPFLTIGVRGKKGKVDGGVWLPVSSVLPGTTRVIQKNCYKDLILPDEVDVFELPDPGPEDRDRYWEFRRRIR